MKRTSPLRGLTVRLLTRKDDVDGLVAVERCSGRRGGFFEILARNCAQHLAGNSEWKAFAALHDGRLVGVGVLNLPCNANKVILGQVFVHPVHRHHGVNDALIDVRLKYATDLGMRRAETRIDGNNSRAVNVYERHGFSMVKRTGVRPGVDVYDGVKELTEPGKTKA